MSGLTDLVQKDQRDFNKSSVTDTYRAIDPPSKLSLLDRLFSGGPFPWEGLYTLGSIFPIEGDRETSKIRRADALQPNRKRVSVGIRQEGFSLGSRTCDVVRYRDPSRGGITSSLRIFPRALSRSFLRSMYIYIGSPSPSGAVDNAYVLPWRCCRSLDGAIVISPGGLYVPYHATSIAPACSFPRVVLAPSPAYPRRFSFSLPATERLCRYEKSSCDTIILSTLTSHVRLNVSSMLATSKCRISDIRRISRLRESKSLSIVRAFSTRLLSFV